MTPHPSLAGGEFGWDAAINGEGKIYCEYDAPNEEAVRGPARRAGLPVDKISDGPGQRRDQQTTTR